ncbi:MAG: hypothetical protein NTZ52_03275 [Chlamydiae bacterium]|nr:hypothetical protein [Chlamydiota bacterium]
MNILNSLNNNASYLGTFSGMMLGCAANVWNNKSLFLFDKTSCNSPFNGFTPFAIINAFRENDFQSMRREGVQGFIKPTPFNIIYPLIHVLPSLSFLLWNSVKEKKDNETNLQSLKKLFYKLTSNLIYPSFHSASLFFTSLLVSEYTEPHFRKLNIDMSGHAWYQISLTIHAINSLKGVHEHGTIKQRKIYALLNTAVAITDAVWAYNTAANCHSVADIVSGAGLVCLSHFGLQIAETVLTKGIDALKMRVTKSAAMPVDTQINQVLTPEIPPLDRPSKGALENANNDAQKREENSTSIDSINNFSSEDYSPSKVAAQCSY